MEIVIKIADSVYEELQANSTKIQANGYVLENAILNGIPLPKEHGKIVDIGKIDEDRIDRDNPVIYLTVNGEYIEAVSLDYLNGLPAIIGTEEKGE